MYYMSHGSLNKYLSSDFKNITWKMKLKFLRHIVKGIKWIHENKIIHRDIHGGNILMNNMNSSVYYESFVADLGFSRPAKEDTKNSEIYGIMPYVAPEIFRKKQYSLPLERPSISEIYSEINSRYWNVDKIFTEAENKRQELFKFFAFNITSKA
ncbi:kinase-like domain-containing protein [Gigaspora rosea]|uniref:Kinase-like domain-containing protein n=1 Tax=Gigaspora rosea TaxID=44941 RepID=A0A397UVS4_9GLOM|nr:kinase-like domain-containing protein [Gigaspora rosea]